jgi:hypothetical protein
VLETILREIKNREKGRNYSTQPWQRFKLDENGYKTLEQSLEDDDYVRNKLRYGSSNKGLVRFANIKTQIQLFPVD